MTLIKTIATPPGREPQHIEMTADEETAFLAEQATHQATQDIAALKGKAQIALDKSDMAALRCMKSGIAFPTEWQTYVTSLRAIISTGTGEVPVQPIYPAGS